MNNQPNQNVIDLADKMGMEPTILLTHMQGLAQFIGAKFVQAGIEVTRENVALVIPKALQQMIAIEREFLNNPQTRIEMYERVYNAIKPEADKRVEAL